MGEIYLYRHDLESKHLGEVTDTWKQLNSKNVSIKKELNENGYSHIFEVINDDKIYDCIVCENIILDEGLKCSQCHITSHVRCSQSLCNCEACGSIRVEYRYINFPILVSINNNSIILLRNYNITIYIYIYIYIIIYLFI